MKTILLIFTLTVATCLSLYAGSAEKEKAFTDKYKAALEAKDSATLESFLYTQGSDPMICVRLREHHLVASPSVMPPRWRGGQPRGACS